MAKILVISERWWPEGSGGELATYLIVKGLAEEGFEVTVMHGSKKAWRIPGVRLVYEPLLGPRSKHLLWLNSMRLARKERFTGLVRSSDTVYIPRISYPLIEAAKRLGRGVVVHIHAYQPVSYSSAVPAPFEEWRGRIEQFNIAMSFRDNPLKSLPTAATQRHVTMLARRWISMADRIVCVSKRQAGIVSQLMPEVKDKITVSYNPPPLLDSHMKEAINKDPKPLLLYSGGDSYIKEFHLLLKALPRVLSLDRGLRIVLTGSYEKVLLQRLEKLMGRSRGRVKLAGYLPYRELLGIKARSWALLFPSI